MPTFTVTVHLPPPLEPAYRAAAGPAFGQAMTQVVTEIASEARAHTPVGVSGILRASIGTRVTLSTSAATLVEGEVFTGAQAPYAEHVEFGTRPGVWRPIAPLKLWAQRVLGDARIGYQIRWAIYRRGTKGRFMFRDAMATVQPRIQGIFEAAAARVAALLNR